MNKKEKPSSKLKKISKCDEYVWRNLCTSAPMPIAMAVTPGAFLENQFCLSAQNVKIDADNIARVLKIKSIEISYF